MGGHHHVPQEGIPRVHIGFGMRKMMVAVLMIVLAVSVPITEVQADVLKTVFITFCGVNAVEHVGKALGGRNG